MWKKHATSLTTAHVLTLAYAAFMFRSPDVMGADTPVPVQPAGEHSTLATQDGVVRDDELADYVCQALINNGGYVKDVKIMVNACFGGGILDDFQRVFGPGGACAGVPWVAGSASQHDSCAYGWCDDVVNAAEHAAKELGSCWTSALAGPATSTTDATPGAMRVLLSNNVKDDLTTARDNDYAGPNDVAVEDPVVGSGNGGEFITWDPAGTSHRAVVFSGDPDAARHTNNVDNVEAALELVWAGSPFAIQKVDGGTNQDLFDAIDAACENIDGDTELVLYFDDHGGQAKEIVPNLNRDGSDGGLTAPFVIRMSETVNFSIQHGLINEMRSMNIQSGANPTPEVLFTLVEPVDADDWQMTFNGVRLPMPSGWISGEVRLPVDWQLLNAQDNQLVISTSKRTAVPMKIDEMSIYSGRMGLECLSPDMQIPTVSEWGMAALVLLVLVAGTVVFRRRAVA